MKKLFIAALALASVVACSKDDEPTLDASKKSISISIENMVNGTRGVTAPSAETTYAVADAEDLYVAFCDATGTITGGIHQLTTGGTKENEGAYTFHGLPETVTQFFVFGNDNGTLKSYASLTEAETAWNNSPTSQEDAEIKDVIVFGKSNTITYVSDCVDPQEGVKYQLFEGAATVVPNVARVEIKSIGCSDLGARDNDGNTTTMGFDKLELVEIALASMNEDLSSYDALTANVVEGIAQPVSVSPANGNVWSWNFAGGAVANYPLALTLDATSESYNVTTPRRTVTATKYADSEGNPVTSFDKSNVYKMDVVVTETNLLGNDTDICVAVTVTIGEWVINNITPDFSK